MKKYLFLLLIPVLLLVGCTLETGNYKKGVYSGYSSSVSYGETLTTMAIVTVNESGKIESVWLDVTYKGKNGELTTKKQLKDDYGMKSVSASKGKIEGGAEWYTQAKNLEDAVIVNQGLDFIELNDDKTTDSVAGVTINIDDLYQALDSALKEAKK